MVKQIALTKGKVTLVDDQDYEYLCRWSWRYLAAPNTGYAFRRTRENGKLICVLMHRVILDAPDDREVDHINRDGLDNRRANLRLVTHAQQMQNRGPCYSNNSGYRGVRWRSDRKKWRARISVDGHDLHLGHFDDPIEAAQAYDRAALQHFGEYAYLNFPG